MNGMPGRPGLKPGTALKTGDFVIEECIASGGNALVYRAEQINLKRYICIKEWFPATGHYVRAADGHTILPTHDLPESESSAGLARFRHEVDIVAAFADADYGTAAAIDAFEENNTAYLVQEFIDGQTLAEFRHEWDENAPDLSPEHALWKKAASFILQAAEIINRFHKKTRCVHADLSASNIFVVRNANGVLRIKVVDFGLACTFDEARNGGVKQYTKGFSPPEAFRHLEKDGQFDVYSLAACLIFLLTGTAPRSAKVRVHGDADDEINAALNAVPPSVKKRVEAVLCNGFALQPKDRYQTMSAFIKALNGALYPLPTDLYKQGCEAYKQKKWKNALELYRRAHDEKGADEYLRMKLEYGMANTLFQLGDYEEAIKQFQTCIESCHIAHSSVVDLPQSEFCKYEALSHYYLAHVYGKQKNLSEAALRFKTALAMEQLPGTLRERAEMQQKCDAADRNPRGIK